MSLTMLDNIGAVILAAGKGARLNCENEPKVMLKIGDRPIVSYIVNTLKKSGFKKDQICLVVGFKKEKVIGYFGSDVSYAPQTEQKGTAHAAYTGMRTLPAGITQVLVLNGDDSAFYKEKTIEDFIASHIKNHCVLSLLTVDAISSTGKIVRYGNGRVEIVEKEYLTEEQKNINETSTGTFMLDRSWFEKIFPDMPILQKLGEYGLPVALAVARDSGKKYQVIKLSDAKEWYGINTPEELALANQYASKKS